MNLSETNFSRTAESQWLWQGAIWTFQFDKLWRHSQKQLQKYNIRDKEYPLVYLQLKRWASQYQHLRYELHFQWGPNIGCALPPGAEGRQCQPGNLQEGTVDIHDVGSASLGRRPNGHPAQDPTHFRRPHLHQTDQVPLLWKDARRRL